MNLTPIAIIVAGGLVAGAILLRGGGAASYPFEADLAARFSDPGSVEIRNVIADPIGKFCGEVNAKNRLGGYVGFQRFIAMPQGSGFRVTLADDVAGQFPVWCSP